MESKSSKSQHDLETELMTELFYAKDNCFILPGHPDNISWEPNPIETDHIYRSLYKLLESIIETNDKRFTVDIKSPSHKFGLEFTAVRLNVSELSKRELIKIKLRSNKYGTLRR